MKRLDTIAVSFDPVAVDAWAATALGFDPAQIEHVQLAQKMGLGTADFRSLSPVELDPRRKAVALGNSSPEPRPLAISG